MKKIINQELRKEILEAMCNYAQESNNPMWDDYIFYVRKKPETFCPGVADKFLMNQIIDHFLDTLPKRDSLDISIKHIGMQLMVRFFYPQYDKHYRVGEIF